MKPGQRFLAPNIQDLELKQEEYVRSGQSGWGGDVRCWQEIQG